MKFLTKLAQIFLNFKRKISFLFDYIQSTSKSTSKNLLKIKSILIKTK